MSLTGKFEMVKSTLQSSPRERIQRYYQGKSLSMVGLKRDVLFAEKVVLCYRCKTRHMLGKNCPVVTPTTEDSGMSLNEQSDTPGENFAPVQPESSGETQLSAESQ